MGVFTFVHTADCHLDTPFVGVARKDPALATRLRQAQRAAFDDLIDVCLERRAAFLLIAGDLYDAQERSLATRVHLRDSFRRLEKAGIDVFLALGNHDNLDETRSGLLFPPNVRVFSHENPQTFFWPAPKPVIAITGMSYERRAIEESLAARYPKPSDDYLNIAVLHCNLDGDPAHGNYSPCRRADLCNSGYHYWALGHIHEQRVYSQNGSTIVYPGCLQGRQIREIGAKGATVVSVDAHGRLEPEFVGLDRVQWAMLDVPVDDAGSEEELAERIRAQMADWPDVDARLEGLVFRVRLFGALGLDQAALDGALEMLRHEAFAAAPFRWPECIDAGRVTPSIDWADLAAEQSPRGDLVRLVAEIRNDPERLQALSECLLEEQGPMDLHRLLGRVTTVEEILDEAMRLGVELLSRPKDK